jgi:hypothetical protein
MADNTGTNNATTSRECPLPCPPGADLYEKYANDAGSDQDLASFFREVQQQERQRAERAKQLLAKRFSRGVGPTSREALRAARLRGAEWEMTSRASVPPTSDPAPVRAGWQRA